MKNYNYLESMIADILDYIAENVEISNYSDREELENYLNDELWTVDQVTGNASGSYTFNCWTARDYVLNNMDILADMFDGFGIESAEIGEHFRSEDWEWFDVSIRCYLLGTAISDALDELDPEFPEESEDMEV